LILQHVNNEPKFRAALREWLKGVLPKRPTTGAADELYEPTAYWWMSELNKVGLGTPHWPKEYGGVDLSVRLQAVLVEEFARADTPTLSMFRISLNHIPATLLAWGTEAQKRKYLPGVANGDVWCQGFSEPGAGSDLASLRCRAEFKGDHYLINGQKTWSSYSMYAQKCILLARTDPTAAKHAGISFFLLDMKAPGVDLRPIRRINGKAMFAELFLTDVKIPVEERVGEEGQGWSVSQTTLSAERGLLFFEEAERRRYFLEQFLKRSVAENADWLKEPELQRQYMKLFGRVQSLRALMRDSLFAEEGSPAHSGIVSAGLKVLFSTLGRDIGAFLMEAAGPAGTLAWDDDFDELSSSPAFVYMTSVGVMIAGGTNDIMRNIISERGLGMPKG
jgi:alkylation response protein AidB-like acyl-CoA dehydrogenase